MEISVKHGYHLQHFPSLSFRLRGTNSKTTHFIFCRNFLAQYPKKGTAIIVAVVILNFSTLSGNNLQVLAPIRHD